MNGVSSNRGGFEKHKLLYRITVSAVFLALAVVLKLVTTFYLPIMGASGLKIDFSGVFSAFPSILFGPWYGGAVCAAADLLGYVLKPSGAFIPALTLTQFLSGFLIGVAALVIKRLTASGINRAKSIIAAVCAAVLTVTALIGVLCCVSLNGDGLIRGITVRQDDLPQKGEVNSRIENGELSQLSLLVCGLARYSSDSLTVVRAVGDNSAEAYVVPQYIEIAGLDTKVTAIGEKCFDGFSSLKTVYIPSTVTAIDASAFDGCGDNLTICTPEGSYAEGFAETAGIACSSVSEEIYQSDRASVHDVPDGFESVSNDNYRKNLRGYIIFMTLGLFCVGAVGALLIGAGMLIKKRNGFGGYALFFVTIAIPRLFITTVNTEILRRTMAVWNGRTFWVLLIPRIGEELVSCLIQAYIIALLYDIYRARIAKNNII